jgi:hypothetical protein
MLKGRKEMVEGNLGRVVGVQWVKIDQWPDLNFSSVELGIRIGIVKAD